MANVVATFTNLKAGDPEKKRRVAAFETAVKAVVAGADLTKKEHADGDWVIDDAGARTYDQKAKNLTGADVYFTSCFPTLRHIWVYWSAKPVVVGGMFYPGNWNNGPSRGDDDYAEYNFYYTQANVHGYVSYDLGIVPRWLRLLANVFQDIGQPCDHIAVITDSRTDPNKPYDPGASTIYTAIDSQTGLGVIPVGIDAGVGDSTLAAVKKQLDAFKANYPNSGIIVHALTLTALNRKELINYINNKIKLPAIYPNELYVNDGGLISLGVDLISLYQAAGQLVGQLLQNSTSTQQLTLWADSDAKFVVTLNQTTATNAYNAAAVAKLKARASKTVT